MTGRHRLASFLGALGIGVLVGSNLGLHPAAVIAVVLTGLALVLWSPIHRSTAVRCPSCSYTVGGPDRRSHYLQHLGPARHILHGVYGPLAELANPAGTVITADLVSQLRPLSYNADPREVPPPPQPSGGRR